MDKFINLPWYVVLATFLARLSAFIYFIIISITLWKYKKSIKVDLSCLERKNMQWLQLFLYIVMGIYTIDIINVYVFNFTFLELPYIISFYVKILFVCGISLLGFYGIKAGHIFNSIKKAEAKFIVDNEYYPLDIHKPVYEFKEVRINNDIKTPSISLDNLREKKPKLIPDQKADIYIQELLNYMEQKKPYLNCDLHIQDIAVALEVPVHVLSFILNHHLEKNFFDFINYYRIEEVKRRLHDSKYDALTIIAIAFDCGFNSKASFNRLFKKNTGITPSQYKKDKGLISWL
ncbi:MAG: helix-turn-helix domain-containing protein [Bacteroidales bacterium]